MILCLILAAVLTLPGVVLLILPIHMKMTGVVLVLLGGSVALCGILNQKKRFTTFSAVLTILAAGSLVVLMAGMNLITCSGATDWERAREADYAVVLGAAVKEDGNASRIMRQRLRAALTFMEENPEACVILSGGQGEDEPVTEAACMYRTILEMGADESRLILEDASFNTRDNLLNSMDIIKERGGTEKPIALITSEFHQRRAAFIADGLSIDTCAVSAHTDQWFYRVNYTLREAFAFVKAALQR